MKQRGNVDWQVRFWWYVQQAGPEECWIWKGTGGRYGHLWVGLKHERAHRMSYLLHIGSIPKGMCVCHTCDVPRCVNPAHLFLGTHQDNMTDRSQKGRSARNIGVKNGRALLTPEDVAAIKEDRRYYYVIAQDYGVSRSAIHAIKSGRIWKSEWIVDIDYKPKEPR